MSLTCYFLASSFNIYHCKLDPVICPPRTSKQRKTITKCSFIRFTIFPSSPFPRPMLSLGILTTLVYFSNTVISITFSGIMLSCGRLSTSLRYPFRWKIITKMVSFLTLQVAMNSYITRMAKEGTQTPNKSD